MHETVVLFQILFFSSVGGRLKTNGNNYSDVFYFFLSIKHTMSFTNVSVLSFDKFELLYALSHTLSHFVTETWFAFRDTMSPGDGLTDG